MNKLGPFLASVSALALLSSPAAAAALPPGAAAGRHLLTQEEIARLPMQKDMNRQRKFTVFLKPGAAGAAAAVENYFHGFGFETEYFSDTNTVKLVGNFAQAERAGNFSYVAGRLPITPLRTSAKPTFPDPVANAILATTFNRGPVLQSYSFNASVPSTMPEHFGVYGLSPADYGAIYGYDKLYKAGYNGRGETVDIAAALGYNPSDLAIFQSAFALSPAPNITVLTSNFPVTSQSEPDLDVQRVYGTAPGAAIRIWFTDGTFGDFINVFVDIAHDQLAHPAAAFSVSYGMPELQTLVNYGSSFFREADIALSAITGGANQKVALFAASGDDGDFSISDSETIQTPLGLADVAFFASDPNVLAVGGTALVLNNKFTRAAEFAWSGSTTGNSGGSGGGVSNFWLIPSWQKGVPGIASQKLKNVPDVSSVASLESPPLIISGGELIPTGGTSAASPTWAGTVALLQEYFQHTHPGSRFTKWPAYFYHATTRAGLFTEITAGSNGRFAAGPGYNNVTGLGVPCLLHFPDFCVDGK
jgi:subtilase family serine protease